MQRLTGRTGKSAHLGADVDRWANLVLAANSQPSALNRNINISVNWQNVLFSSHPHNPQIQCIALFLCYAPELKYDGICQHMPDKVFPKIAVSRRAVLSTVIIHLTKCTKGG